MPPPFRRNWWLSSQKKMKPDSGSLIGFRHCPSIKPVHPDKPSFWPRIQDLYLIKMHYRTCFSSEGCQKRSPPNVRRVHQPTWIRNCFYCTSVISYFKLFISVDSWLIPNVNELKSLTKIKNMTSKHFFCFFVQYPEYVSELNNLFWQCDCTASNYSVSQNMSLAKPDYTRLVRYLW